MNFKRARDISLTIAVLIPFVFVPVLFLRGMVWASERALPWVIEAGQIAVAICGWVLLPLCVFRKTRIWAGLGFIVASYVLGVELFAYSCIVVFIMWSYAGLVLGLVLGVIGVVPLAVLAAFIAAIEQRTQWSLPASLMFGILLIFGTRYLGAYLVGQENERRLRYTSKDLATQPAGHFTVSVSSSPLNLFRPRVLVVSTEEATNKAYSDRLCRNGYDAVGCDVIRHGLWSVEEAIEDAKAFQPQVVLLFQNLRFTKEMTGLDLALMLFECLPNTRFIVGRLGDTHCVSEETLREVLRRGYKFETFVIAPNGENLVEMLQR